jgi:aerobic carbon-monoxide dehydrogenase small subunit
MTLCKIALIVNDRRHELTIQPNRRLIDVLREDLALTGTKEGCGIGVCGACTVMMDGKTVSACLTLAVAAAGRSIVTIEGLESDGQSHPIQQAFVERSGIQCGFCTPGQIMATKALLDEFPNPTDDQIGEQLKGNLCRCTGYYKIIDSVKAAAVRLGDAK